MKGKIKFSYWIITGLIIILITTLIPWDDVLPAGPKVGIVEINMPITDSKKAVQELNYFNEKSNINAIVVRLETPGGGVAASQEIYEKVRKISEESSKPIIASMGGVAASGGYYIALGADTIIANHGTATGSIGVILGFPVVAELMDKLGIRYESIKSGDLKDSGSIFRDLSKEERGYFQNLIDDLHHQFVRTVAWERKMSLEKVQQLATGQVFSGEQAVAAGLVDMLGTLEDAVQLASQKAGFDKKPDIIYPPEEKKGLLDILFGDILQRSSLGNLLIYPKPEYRLNY